MNRQVGRFGAAKYFIDIGSAATNYVYKIWSVRKQIVLANNDGPPRTDGWYIVSRCLRYDLLDMIGHKVVWRDNETAAALRSSLSSVRYNSLQWRRERVWRCLGSQQITDAAVALTGGKTHP